MSAPTSRPVHPCVVSLTDRARGAEFAVWIRLPTTPYSGGEEEEMAPHLVTACANSIAIYSVHHQHHHPTAADNNNNNKDDNEEDADDDYTLRLVHSWNRLAGTVVSLSAVPGHYHHSSGDAILVGFGGHARLTLLTPPPSPLSLHQRDGSGSGSGWTASTLVDLTSVVNEASGGAITPGLEQDVMVAVDSHNHNNNNNTIRPTNSEEINNTNSTNRTNRLTPAMSSSSTTTAACILGGGVAVAVLSIQCHHARGNTENTTNTNSSNSSYYWTAQDPYILPLRTIKLPHNLPTAADSAAQQQQQQHSHSGHTNTSMTTGFGDILHAAFLPGYLEPVVVLLHTGPNGRIGSGRWASGCPPPTYCTAISVSTAHARAAMLWSVSTPSDAFALQAIPPSESSITGGGVSLSSMVVMAVNSLTFLDADGRVEQCLAVNGWARSTVPPSSAVAAAATPPGDSAGGGNSNSSGSGEGGGGISLRRNPTIPLAIQLDGASLGWMSPAVAVLTLRHGQIYILQKCSPIPGTSASPKSQQRSSNNDDTFDSIVAVNDWSILPTGQTAGGVGEVADLVTLALPNQWMSKPVAAEKSAWWLGENKEVDKTNANERNAGLIFAASRLGDSLLLGYCLESATIPRDTVEMKSGNESTSSLQKQQIARLRSSTDSVQSWNEEDDEIFRLEDEALYKPAVYTEANLVPPSDDESETNVRRKRARLEGFELTKVQTLTPLDRLVNLGPLGPSCEGPLGRAPTFLTEPLDDLPNITSKIDRKTVFGTFAHVFPAGYGTSGGLALMTVPGRDDRMIIAEEDCFNASCVFSLPLAGVVLLGMSSDINGGIRVMRTHGKEGTGSNELSEVFVEEWCSDGIGEGNSDFLDSWEVFQSTLLFAGEGMDGRIYFVVRARESTNAVLIVSTKETDGRIDIIHHHRIDWSGGKNGENSTVVKVSPILMGFLPAHSCDVAFGCLWLNGDATFVSVTRAGEVEFNLIPRNVDAPDDSMEVEVDLETLSIRDFYADGGIAAIDVFHAPSSMFSTRKTAKPEHARKTAKPEHARKTAKPELAELASNTTMNHSFSGGDSADRSKLTVPKLKEALKARGLSAVGKKAELIAALESSDLEATSRNQQQRHDIKVNAPTLEMLTETSGLTTPVERNLAFDDDDDDLYGWSDFGGSGSYSAQRSAHSEQASLDTFVAVCKKSGELEIYSTTMFERPLWRGLYASSGANVIERNVDDSYKEQNFPRSHKIYVDEMRFFSCGPTKLEPNHSPSHLFCLSIVTSEGDLHVYKMDSLMFHKIPLGIVSRSSQEQSRHYAKLVRKGAVRRDSKGDILFKHNILHRFTGISGQDGLFMAGPRPLWLVGERGALSVLAHRSRHAAPAGGRPRPVTGFCSSISTFGGYLTLHERIGRVGSQRLSLYSGLSGVFNSSGILTGSGFCFEKIPFGVTVRQIVYLEDESISSGDHPLYAVLVSREVEVDQSNLNTDGLSNEERQNIEDERNAAKIQRQVEADLGGFEVESEWVESIERERFFNVDLDLGGAPPLHQSIYSLWVVDAADNWLVVDSYELGEHEHGIDLKAMALTEFTEEPDSSTSEESDERVQRNFVVVGTGIVNHDGEDVSTKGRLLMFEVKRSYDNARLASSTVAELTLTHEKSIFHGPLTTVSCLSTEGKKRLVLGAGSDINIEQWSDGKLTQVGFFRATMHISDVMHFKNFMLLSDAYDSMYFLVWRESDKSLTLLAKDYDPIPVHAAGIMTRGAAMTFICHDDRENLQFFQYAPGEAAARGGNKLVCRADFHLGSQTTAFRSHYCRPSLLVNSATPVSTLSALKQQDTLFGRQDDEQRLGVHFGTTDGGVGSIVPLSEPVYWRLLALQSVLSNALESDCALSQRGWRLYRRSTRRGGCRSNDRKKGVIDGDIVAKYADLEITEQEDVASAIGSTVELILDNLLELQCASMIN